MKVLTGILNGNKCPECGNAKLYSLSDGRFKCASCYHKFSPRMVQKDSEVLRLFAEGYSANKAARESGYNYRTVANRYVTYRREIVEYLDHLYRRELQGKVPSTSPLLQEPQMRNNGKPRDEIKVLGLLELNGNVYTVSRDGITPDVLLNQIQDHVDKCRIYSALPFRSYHSFELTHRIPVTGNTESAGSALGQFWNYLTSELRKHRGTSSEYFHLYLKELEFRFRTQEQEVFSLLAGIHFGIKEPS